MRVVFIGAVQFSASCLEVVLSSNAQVVGVCTLKESKFNADHQDLSPIAKEFYIPCLYVEDINSDTSLKWIKERQPDVIFCFGWSRLLKRTILDIAPLGVVGFHPTALPANRGRHPLIWALFLGLKKTASTFFFMDEGADSGDILSQEEVTIDSSDDARSLYQKVTQTALSQIEDFIPLLENRSYIRTKQDNRKANYWRKRGIKDGEIDWRMSAISICNLVRALTKPYTGAHFTKNGEEIKVWKVEVLKDENNQNIEPGKVLSSRSSKPVVKCGDGSIILLDIENKFELTEGDYL
ncbi:formyltransferase family protein [Opitutales bacterium]|nr:formyltransferase family protein [Opitutales bacterium]